MKINVALRPQPRYSNMLATSSRYIADRWPARFALGPDCLPHLTIAQGEIEQDYLLVLYEYIQRVADRSPLTLSFTMANMHRDYLGVFCPCIAQLTQLRSQIQAAVGTDVTQITANTYRPHVTLSRLERQPHVAREQSYLKQARQYLASRWQSQVITFDRIMIALSGTNGTCIHQFNSFELPTAAA